MRWSTRRELVAAVIVALAATGGVLLAEGGGTPNALPERSVVPVLVPDIRTNVPPAPPPPHRSIGLIPSAGSPVHASGGTAQGSTIFPVSSFDW